jgi:hypothetical protein
MLIEIKHRYKDTILFSYEIEDNTIAKTIEESIKQGANL